MGDVLGEQTGGEKLAGLLSRWQPLVKLFSQGAGCRQLISGVGMPDINQKVDPRIGYKKLSESRGHK
jgi:hypothetical protein